MLTDARFKQSSHDAMTCFSQISFCLPSRDEVKTNATIGTMCAPSTRRRLVFPLAVAAAALCSVAPPLVLGFTPATNPTSASRSPLLRLSASSIESLPNGEKVNDDNAKESTTSPTAEDPAEGSSFSSSIRPLHQNWFPVSIITALEDDRPNAIELLGQKLVLFHDAETSEWKCLADRCSHRFAPLSEGRIVPRSEINEKDTSAAATGGCSGCTIQCAYHGWEFSTEGKCTRVPQQSPSQGGIDEKRAAPVPVYPVREEAGMVWVWSDPDPNTWATAEDVVLPISPLVRKYHEKFGANACFMRDLPYGMEYLGENLLDLSHLPFSHHSVGGLDRDLGGELPLRTMSEKERKEYSLWEEKFNKENGLANQHAIPLHQVEVANASHTDPIFLSIAKRFPKFVSEDANATISFFEPCHVRYRRERISGSYGQVELFMSPTSAGRSRVFLWNTIDAPAPPPATTLKSRLAKYSPPALFKKYLIKKLMNPASVRAHSISHAIFDGDGIFLHKQGDRMRRSGLTFRDYSTPSSADVLLNAYRRYLDAAAARAIAADKDLSSSNIGASAAYAVSYQSNEAYGDNVPRSQLLDRYTSHTANCAICSAELAKCKKSRKICETIQTALVGACGASLAGITASLVVGGSSTIPKGLVKSAAISTIASVAGALGLSKKKKSLDTKIDSFHFEDYIHAEKN